MPTYTEISPNEPDVAPEYVDCLPDAVSDHGRTPPPLSSREDTAEETDASPEAADAIQAAAPEPAAPRFETDLDGGTAEEEEWAPPLMQAEAGHREGECIPNVPDSAPEIVRDDAVAAPPPRPAEPGPEAAAASPFVRWHLLVTVLTVSVLGILVFGQAASSIALAASLPLWARYALLIPLGLCCLAALGVCVGLAISWLRLRAIRQVDMAALEDLRRRAQTRRDGVEHYQAARTQLERYLQSYPLTTEGRKRLLAAGIKDEGIESLAKNRDFLVGRSIDSRAWLEEFRLHFQGDLDQAAERRVRVWSLKAAGCVIASPLPLLDSILVLSISLKLIKDLCVLYNVRSSRTGSLVLLNRTIVTAFIAGVADNAVETAAEELTDFTAESTLGAMGARMAGLVGPKLGEGAINAFFIHRLGRAAIRMLQPLKP